MTNRIRGSTWNKWDLHIHTPLSLVQSYGGDRPEVWDRFISELEALPSEFKVIGINDYLFIDGYKKVLAEKQAGRLPNIDRILPVVEFRLDKFAGMDGDMNRVNFHVIFSSELSADIIEQQFLNALASTYVVDARYPWQAVLTRDSLTDLGQKITDATPADKRAQLDTPLKVGFNNFCLSSDKVFKLLENPIFKGKHLTAIGRGEWSQIHWDGAGTAEKRTLIERSDLVFTSAESIEKYQAARTKLKQENVNNRLLDCSDAHFFAGAEQYNQIGKCYTWIKADTTFEGLKQVLIEFDERVWIGDTPDQIKTTRAKPGRFIDTLKIDKTPGSDLKETWFHQTIEFNPGLVAIIGNRGSGKSALADTLGLLGHTQHADKFSFLTPKKFCQQKQNKGRHFTATIKWLSGASSTALLDSNVEAGAIELAKYIPQNFLETICNEVGRPEESEFDKELKAVIFSRIGVPARLGQSSLDELIKFQEPVARTS